jgi:hypothetical protein
VAAITPTETPQPAVVQPDTAATATAAWQSGDDDQDGLANADEVAAGTLPDSPDSDQDELDDLEETNQFKTDPLEADTDGDNLADGVEVSQGLNPLAADTDGDGLLDASDPDPSNLPTPTPTSPPATDTPTPEATATSVPTEEPTVTPTPGAVNVVSAPAGAAAPGVFQDFESQSAWRRGDQANGAFERTTAQTHSGSYAGQLDYNFPSANNDFVVFLQTRALGGRPTALTAWVYGDGAGHFLNTWIKDSGGQVWGMSFGQVSHTGWQQMTAQLDPNQPWPSGHISGPDNGAIDYPISFQALTLDDGNDGFSGQGTIYIDDLSSQEGAPVSATTPSPAATTAPAAPVAETPGAANSDFQLKIEKFSYVQPWGAPRNGDVCQTFKNQNWDDTQAGYRSLSVELSLTNNSASPIPDDWGGVVYVTGKGEQGLFCRYEYPGSGPPSGESRSVTFFTVIRQGDYIQYIRLQPLAGQQLELCLNSDGSTC